MQIKAGMANITLVCCNVVEAHCYGIDKDEIYLEYVSCRINNNLIRLCMQLMKAYNAETSCNQVVIDYAAYMYCGHVSRHQQGGLILYHDIYLLYWVVIPCELWSIA